VPPPGKTKGYYAEPPGECREHLSRSMQDGSAHPTMCRDAVSTTTAGRSAQVVQNTVRTPITESGTEHASTHAASGILSQCIGSALQRSQCASST
jgi:hypothetical protein